MFPRTLGLIVLALCLTRGTGYACVGTECLRIWSTEPDGGALTIEYDFDSKIQTYESFCTGDRSVCLFSAIDPGFIATAAGSPGGSFYPLADGTRVRIEVLSVADGLTIRINGQRIDPGQSASLGEMPSIHVHPSWQIAAPGDVVGDFALTYKLTTDSSQYEGSAELTSIVTNEAPPPEPKPTASPTPEVLSCLGDCDDDANVTVDEILRGVGMALGLSTVDDCPAFDGNGDHAISVDEIIGAVVKALEGCESIVPVSFAEIEQAIFTPRCAVALCHDSTSKAGALDLAEGRAYGQLVDVEPDILSARAAGLLRVRAGEPETSFLLIKLIGPPPAQGSRMPLLGRFLTPEEIDLVRNWILQGALP